MFSREAILVRKTVRVWILHSLRNGESIRDKDHAEFGQNYETLARDADTLDCFAQ
jgi:hypothetical protein